MQPPARPGRISVVIGGADLPQAEYLECRGQPHCCPPCFHVIIDGHRRDSWLEPPASGTLPRQPSQLTHLTLEANLQPVTVWGGESHLGGSYHPRLHEPSGQVSQYRFRNPRP